MTDSRVRYDPDGDDNPDVKAVSGEVYAREFDGATLADKIVNAVNALPDSGGDKIGRVRVTSRQDGQPWQWPDSGVTWNPQDWNGIQIDVDNNVEVVYGGSDWMFTLDHAGNTNFDHVPLYLTGGLWRPDGTGDPSGFMRIIDGGGVSVAPYELGTPSNPWSNSTNSAWVLEIRNKNQWSEGNSINIASSNADNGINFVPADNNPNSTASGTNSFHDTIIKRFACNLISDDGIGIHCDGKFQYVTVEGWIKIFLKANNCTGVELDGKADGWYDGTTFENLKVEEIGAGTNGQGVRITSDYDGFRPPLFLNSKPNGGSAALIERNGSSEIVPFERSSGGALERGSLGQWTWKSTQEGVSKAPAHDTEPGLPPVSDEDGVWYFATGRADTDGDNTLESPETDSGVPAIRGRVNGTYVDFRAQQIDAYQWAVANGTGNDLGAVISEIITAGEHPVRLHIAKRPDGTTWQWDSDVRVDVRTAGNFVPELDFDHDVEVEYTGGANGVPLWVEGTQTGTGRVVWNGGVISDGGSVVSALDTVLRLDDCVRSHIAPQEFNFYTTVTDDPTVSRTGIEVRNVDANDAAGQRFSELNRIKEFRVRGPNGIDFVTPDEITGSGSQATDSFQGTKIEDIQVNNFVTGGWGLRLNGNMRYSAIDRPNIFPNGDDSVAIQLNTSDALGMTIQTVQGETSSGATNTATWGFGSDYSDFNAPIIVGEQTEESSTSRKNGSGAVPSVRHAGGNILLGDIDDTPSSAPLQVDPGGSVTVGNGLVSNSNIELTAFNGVLNASGGGPLFVQDQGGDVLEIDGTAVSYSTPAELYTADVRSIGSPSDGMIARHDGSGTDNPSGAAEYDGGSWYHLVSGQVID